MRRIDPVVVFIVALIAWAFLVAALVGGCGGAQRRCQQADAMGLKGGGAPRCQEESR